MFSVRQMALPAALATAVLIVFGVTSSAASNPWPTCLGEPATIVGTDGNDTITGTGGDHVIVGLGGDDVIASGGASDVDLICGGDGNDTVIVTSSGDIFDFGIAVVSGDAGDDRIQASKDTIAIADYESSPEPITADLGAGTETGWGNDTLVRVLGVDASPFDDTLKGTGGMDVFYGEGGNDTINGLGGTDYIAPGIGDDKVDGGGGSDWVDYFDAAAGVRVNLAKGTSTGGSGADTLRSIEAVGGSKYADVLVGSPGANRLEGLGGNDRLYGEKGKDRLIGGKGKDRADGGPARDVCQAEKKVHCP
jgi:Ca2+-binding RTX toxin-like protein